jgi:hypothetical protein
MLQFNIFLLQFSCSLIIDVPSIGGDGHQRKEDHEASGAEDVPDVLMPGAGVHDPGHKPRLDGLEYYIGDDQYGADDHRFFIVAEKREVLFHVVPARAGRCLW